jgi:lipoyl(octanoyl) transferase
MLVKEVVYQDIANITYQDAWNLQTEYHKRLVDQKLQMREIVEKKWTTPHKIFFCEHNHVYTLGKSGTEANLLLTPQQLIEENIEYFKINRGGDITYHGPGQITGYPILDLEHIYTDIHRYIRDMEEAVIKTIATFGIVGTRLDGYTGVWIAPDTNDKPFRKICAIGVHMSRWISMHGFALNVNTDLAYFNKIIPCGIADADKEVTSIAHELGRTVNIEEVKKILLEQLCLIYGLKIIANNENP